MKQKKKCVSGRCDGIFPLLENRSWDGVYLFSIQLPRVKVAEGWSLDVQHVPTQHPTARDRASPLVRVLFIQSQKQHEMTANSVVLGSLVYP